MAIITYPLNNILYSAEDAELYNSTRGSGIYAKDSFGYSVTGQDNVMTIGTGIGWIKNGDFSGKVIAQKEAAALDMGVADAVYPRIDAVVLQFSMLNNNTALIAKQGTPASVPLPPEITRTESVYELHLFHVERPAGAVAITESNITDMRLSAEHCGLMADSVTSIDTTAIEAQVRGLIERLEAEIRGVETGTEVMLRATYDPDNDGMIDMAYDSARIGGTPASEIPMMGALPSIPENTDINGYAQVGNHACYTMNTALTLINTPFTTAFVLFVFDGTGSNTERTQIAISRFGDIKTRNTYNLGSTWSAWRYPNGISSGAVLPATGEDGDIFLLYEE